MNNQNQLKKQAAEAALSYIPSGIILGVGTGSTVNCFIDALVKIKGRIDGAYCWDDFAFGTPCCFDIPRREYFSRGWELEGIFRENRTVNTVVSN